MPRQRRSRFTRRKANALPGRPPISKRPCCVVCYNEFTPYPLTCHSWEASMGKVFYKVLNIPSSQTNGDNVDIEEDASNEDDDSIISLPFCAQCHSKVSVMFSLYNQLQFIQEQFCSVRNDVAFTVVETISKNCRNGPMDFIRQQICQQWQTVYNEAKERIELDCTPIDGGCDSKNAKLSSLDKICRTDIAKSVVASEELTSVRPIKEEESLKRRAPSPVPAMPKLIPMAVLQAEAQRNRSGRPNHQFKGKIKKPLVNDRDKSPDISPPSPVATQTNLGNGTLQSKRFKTGLKPVGRPAQVKVDYKKKTEKKGRSKLDSSDESFEGLTTKDIILKQNSLAVSEEEELHGCKLCPRQYSTLSRLMRHESLCHPMLKALRCELCPKGFSSALTLRRHMQNIHHSAIEGYTMCPLCDRSFIKKYAFEVHLRGHEKQGLVVPSVGTPAPTSSASRQLNPQKSKRLKGYSQNTSSSRTLTAARATKASKFLSHHHRAPPVSKSTILGNKLIRKTSRKDISDKRPASHPQPTKIAKKIKLAPTNEEDEDSEDPNLRDDSDSDYDP